MRQFTNRYWYWLKRTGFTNLRVNRLVHRITDEELVALGIPILTLNISSDDYSHAVRSEFLQSYRQFLFPHRKVLEYLVSWKLGKLLPEITALCDFAGGEDPFAAWMRVTQFPEAKTYAVDPLLSPDSVVQDDVIRVRGDSRNTHLETASLDLITCHHSIEHFRDDQDTTAVCEFARALRSGGMAVITPIFLATAAFEIWNTAPSVGVHSPGVTRLIDRTSPFPGWGPFEGFARVYSIDTFKKRILEPLAESGNATLYRVTYDGLPCPDLSFNKGLPAFCGSMLSLCFRKS